MLMLPVLITDHTTAHTQFCVFPTVTRGTGFTEYQYSSRSHSHKDTPPRLLICTLVSSLLSGERCMEVVSNFHREVSGGGIYENLY